MNQNHSIAPKYTLSDALGNSISRKEALKIIHSDQTASNTFYTFPTEDQEKLIAFLQGNRGLEIVYNNFFLYVMNVEQHPDRIEDFLSALLQTKIKIKQILPREGNMLSDKGSLVIMDIIVELKDGSIANLEIQKIGYNFPGQRSSCYISDSIMRQYNRIKSKRGKKFTFKDMKPVYQIILMEKSSPEFSAVSPKYIHNKKSFFDSGVQLQFLDHITYVSLDTFHENIHNINTELDAWLTFLSSNEPDDIIRLINAYPKFLDYYNDIAMFRKNPKELITMYSEALAILDHNTVMYMMDEMSKELEEKKKMLTEMEDKIVNSNAELANSKAELNESRAELANSKAELANSKAELAYKNTELADKEAEIARLKAQIAALKN